MAVTNPPIYLQAGSHPAEDVRRYTDASLDLAGIANPGALAVTQNGTPNMSVNVAAGRAFVLGNESAFQGVYHVDSRAIENRAIAAADATNPRKDLVVARVKDAAYSGVVNAWDIEVVTGTPAPSPSEPAVPANSLVLAMVSVAALATSIVNANITDRRTTQAGQNRATALGGIVTCTSTSRPSHKEGRAIYETDTDILLISDGASWLDPRNLLAAAVAGDRGKKFHVASFSVTTAGDGKQTITHGAGFTPSLVIMYPTTLGGAGLWWQSATGSYTGTTFQGQWRDQLGAVIATANVQGVFICIS